jgi:hypothetical protein
VHDIADLESRGIPAVFVASREFVSAASAQSEALGFPAAVVFVDHPIQDRTDEEIRLLADGALPDLVAAIMVETQGPSEGRRNGRPAQPHHRSRPG